MVAELMSRAKKDELLETDLDVSKEIESPRTEQSLCRGFCSDKSALATEERRVAKKIPDRQVRDSVCP